MKIKLIWVGKTKERFIRDGIRNYLDLLQYYAHMEVVEIKEEKGKDSRRIIDKEGERMAQLKGPFILLDEHGKNMSSVEFAHLIEKCGSSASFVIGGAFGVSDELRDKAAERISLSRMTLTHEMARLVLLEQIYRAFTIIHKRSYHH